MGAQVASALVGVPHPRDEPLERGVVEARRRDDDALVLEPARLRREAAGLDAADVGVVRARDREAHPRAGDERDVWQVRAAGKGVVEDPGLVGSRVVGAHGGHGVGHRA